MCYIAHIEGKFDKHKESVNTVDEIWESRSNRAKSNQSGGKGLGSLLLVGQILLIVFNKLYKTKEKSSRQFTSTHPLLWLSKSVNQKNK